MSLLPRQLRGGRARRGNAERFAKLLTVARDDCDFTTTTGSTNVKQFLFHGIGGQNHSIHCLVLATMRCKGVAVVKLAIICRQSVTILKLNASLLDTAHRPARRSWRRSRHLG